MLVITNDDIPRFWARSVVIERAILTVTDDAVNPPIDLDEVIDIAIEAFPYKHQLFFPLFTDSILEAVS